MFFTSKPTSIISAEKALAGRSHPILTAKTHFVFNRPLQPPYPDNYQQAIFGAGCFWGVERKFWQLPKGIYITAAGYAGGTTPNPTYEEVCSGLTGHNEVVLVVFDPNEISYLELLKTFFEMHDPTQGMRQGNDSGTQYRSGIYTTSAEQNIIAQATLKTYEKALKTNGFGSITTEIVDNKQFYFAEDYHQQYLGKNPNGYCGIQGANVLCTI
jgi:peptide-methionine (S)-S-oxide reductase